MKTTIKTLLSALLLFCALPTCTWASEGDTALHSAIENQDISGITLILNAISFFNQNTDGNQDTLLNRPNNAGTTPLHLAADQGNIQIATLLLNAGAAVNLQNNEGQTPLHLAIIKDSLEMANLLLTHGADTNIIDNGNNTALSFAMLLGHHRITQRLIQHIRRGTPPYSGQSRFTTFSSF